MLVLKVSQKLSLKIAPTIFHSLVMSKDSFS